jgi:hypothetical protein
MCLTGGVWPMALKMLSCHTMLLLKKTRRILIPDVPPPVRREFDQDQVIAVIGAVSAVVLIGALLFVFLAN